MKTSRIAEYVLISAQEKKQQHLHLAKVYQLGGMPETAANQFSKACEIHLKLSDKNKAQ